MFPGSALPNGKQQQQPGQQEGEQKKSSSVFGQTGTGFGFGSGAISQSVFGTPGTAPAAGSESFAFSQPVASIPAANAGSVFGQAFSSGSLGFGSAAVPTFGASVGTSSVFGTPSTGQHQSVFGAFASENNKPAVFGSISKQDYGLLEATAPATASPASIDRVNRFTAHGALSNVRDELKKERDKREEDYYKNYKPVSLVHAKSIVGTCMDMCPLYERHDREFSQELHPFEIVLLT